MAPWQEGGYAHEKDEGQKEGAIHLVVEGLAHGDDLIPQNVCDKRVDHSPKGRE